MMKTSFALLSRIVYLQSVILAFTKNNGLLFPVFVLTVVRVAATATTAATTSTTSSCENSNDSCDVGHFCNEDDPNQCEACYEDCDLTSVAAQERYDEACADLFGMCNPESEDDNQNDDNNNNNI